MSDRETTIAAIIGAVLGIAVGGYLLVYLPMQANIERNGCPWLICPPAHHPSGKDS